MSTTNLNTLYAAVANFGHETWKKTFVAGELAKGNEGPYTRVKTTEDVSWIQTNGTDKVDIFNTLYADLPSDWQATNLGMGTFVVNAVMKAITAGTVNLEELSASVHAFWLVNYGAYADPVQKLDYNDPSFPETEREKDRLWVRAALDAIAAE